MVGSEDLGVDRYNVIRVTGYWKIYGKFRIIRGKKTLVDSHAKVYENHVLRKSY